MPRHLIVTQPFDGFNVGDRITDRMKVDAVEAGANAAHVVPIEVEEEPAPRARRASKSEPPASSPAPTPPAADDET